MVKLKQIKKNNNKITCDVFVEDCEEAIRVALDMNSGQIEDYTLPKGYEWCTTHMAYVRRFLKTLVDSKNVPEKRTIMWY